MAEKFSAENFSVEKFAVRIAEGRSNGRGPGGGGRPPPVRPTNVDVPSIPHSQPYPTDIPSRTQRSQGAQRGLLRIHLSMSINSCTAQKRTFFVFKVVPTMDSDRVRYVRSIRSIRSIRYSKNAKFRNATFEGIKPIVPGFFRIGIRFERIPGRLASFSQKWQKF